ATPRAPARLARGRSRAAQGGRRSLRCRGDRARPAPRPLPEPLGALPADRMADEAVTIRRATEADEAVLRELWEEFEREVPEPVGEPETWAEEWQDTLDDIRGGGVFLAESGGAAVGVGRIEAPVRGVAVVQLVHVREHARRQGVAKA